MARERQETVSGFVRDWIRRTLLKQEDEERRGEALAAISRMDLPPPEDLAVWKREYAAMKRGG